MFTVHNIDADINAAWASYRTALADRLAADFVTHVITAHYDAPGEQPSMRFSTTGNHRLRCEITLDLMAAEAVEALDAAGWRWRSSGTYVYECARRLPDKAAAQAVWVLREIWQILHPAFLDSSGPVEPSVHVTVRPHGRRHLQNLAAAAAARLLDADIDRDETGGIYLHLGTAPSWLDARSDEPTLEFRASLVENVPDIARAHSVLDRARHHWPDVNFTLDNGEAIATLHLESSVFVSRNLESALARWVDFMQDGHRRVVDELLDADVPELPRALQCLLHLEDLNPKQVAKICAFNRDDILVYIRLSGEQVIEWRRSAADSTDAEESTACSHEADAWERTRQQLIEALRYVVLDRKG